MIESISKFPMKRFTQPWRPCRNLGTQHAGNAACSPRPEVIITARVTPAPSPRWTFRDKGGATMPTCRPADLPTCRPADLPTCRPADLPTCRPADLPFGAWMTDGGTRPALSMPAWAQAFPPSSTPRWRISPQAPPQRQRRAFPSPTHCPIESVGVGALHHF
jgi:hypothetical protein